MQILQAQLFEMPDGSDAGDELFEIFHVHGSVLMITDFSDVRLCWQGMRAVTIFTKWQYNPVA
jgi:hypothetical protein